MAGQVYQRPDQVGDMDLQTELEELYARGEEIMLPRLPRVEGCAE